MVLWGLKLAIVGLGQNGGGEWFKAVSIADSFKKIWNKKRSEIDIYMR